jgi:hypothetical protein
LKFNEGDNSEVSLIQLNHATKNMSLGWLSESTILPVRKQAIHGITSNTLVNLKAALYDTQQESKKNRSNIPRSTERTVSTSNSKNQGVEQRIQRDLQRMRAEEHSQSYEASQEALQRKALLYQKMMNGEIDVNEEQQLVDFDTKIFRKETVTEENVPSLLSSSTDNQQLLDNNSNVYNSSRSRSENSHACTTTKTISARELVKKIRKQRKQKIQKRAAKLKQRAANGGLSSSFASAIRTSD